MVRQLLLTVFLLSAILTNTLAQAKNMESFKSGYAPVNGLKMYYEIHGKGEMPLVLIHGGGSNIESSFKTLLPLLSDHTQLIAVELQTHGRTTDRDAPESFEQDADDVYALLQHLKIPKANILGFSNGGSTALQIAIRHPQVVNKLIPISAATKRNGLVAGFFDFMPKATLENMPQALKDIQLKVNPDHKILQSLFEKDKQRMINFKDWPDEQLKGITAATLIIVSDKDVVTVAHAQELTGLITGSSLVVLPGAHGGLIGDAGIGTEQSRLPTITAELIKDFLEK